MEKKNVLTKILALAGTIMVWLPFLLMIVTGAVKTIMSGILHVDYLMPAEFFPVELIGGFLLLWASLRSRLYRRPIVWCLAAAAAFLVGGQAIAVISGLASGAIEPAGWPIILAVAAIALYALALVALGVVGICLAKKLFSGK